MCALHSGSGMLILLRGEEPIHRCGSLTPEDEADLLLMAGWMNDNPL